MYRILFSAYKLTTNYFDYYNHLNINDKNKYYEHNRKRYA